MPRQPFGHFRGLIEKQNTQPRGRPVGTGGTYGGVPAGTGGITGDYAGSTGYQNLVNPQAPQIPQTPSTPTTPANPALDGMKHTSFQDFLGELGQGINIPTGRSTQELQALYSQMRGQIQGGTATEMEQARTYMGGRGFRTGESGIADRPMAQIARGGQERLAGAAQGVYLDEANRRFAEQSQLAGLNLQRQGMGGQLGLQSEQGAANLLAQIYGIQTQAQQARWQPYWSGLISSYGGGGGY